MTAEGQPEPAYLLHRHRILPGLLINEPVQLAHGFQVNRVRRVRSITCLLEQPLAESVKKGAVAPFVVLNFNRVS